MKLILIIIKKYFTKITKKKDWNLNYPSFPQKENSNFSNQKNRNIIVFTTIESFGYASPDSKTKDNQNADSYISKLRWENEYKDFLKFLEASWFENAYDIRTGYFENIRWFVNSFKEDDLDFLDYLAKQYTKSWEIPDLISIYNNMESMVKRELNQEVYERLKKILQEKRKSTLKAEWKILSIEFSWIPITPFILITIAYALFRKRFKKGKIQEAEEVEVEEVYEEKPTPKKVNNMKNDIIIDAEFEEKK